MSEWSRCCGLVLALLAAVSSAAQKATHRARQAASPPLTVRLRVISTVAVSSLPSQGLGLPVVCGSHNTIVARFTPMGGSVSDPVAISPEGTIAARFDRAKIYDVPQPVPLDMFLADKDLYLLTMGQTPQGYQTKWRTPHGEVVERPAIKGSYFIAHYKEDGSYDRAIRLDISFKPIQIGVFKDGSFLIAGQDQETGNPRIAIVSPDGAFRSWVDLKGDVHAQKPESEKDQTALPRYAAPGDDSLNSVLGLSQIVPNGSELLLVRPVGSSLFSISSGGEVKTTKLKVPSALNIFTVKPTSNAWIVELMHEESGKGELFDTYAFDPSTGEPRTHYLFPNDLGFGLACADDEEFTLVMEATDGTGLKLVKLAPGSPGDTGQRE